MFELICIILGVLALIIGVAASPNIVWLIVVGVVFLALGGIWFIFIGDNDFNLFD